MTAEDWDTAELERAIREVLPGRVSDVRPSGRRDHSAAAQIDLGVPVGGVQFLIEVLGAGGRARLIDAAESLRSEDGMSDPSRIPVLVSRYFSPENQQLLRDMHVAFIDFAGNAWLVADGLHVDRRGFPSRSPEARGQRDPFSDKASLVLRVLMREPAPLGVRQIAEIASSQHEAIRLTAGYVSKVVAELERRGYIGKHGDKVVLRRAEDLLRDWVVSYRSRKRPSARSYFLPAASVESLIPRVAASFDAAGVEYVFTGHAGASLVDRYADFDAIDLYVKHMDDAGEVLARSGARVVERGGNVKVAVPYYRVSAFFDDQVPKGGMHAASDLQLYLDLYDYPVRGREQAEHLYDRRLRPLLERGDAL
ncbi:MAG TPA: type IV toxin-antitoxin system AbiEi family antitoxin [Coriobacteriia bacterium]